MLDNGLHQQLAVLADTGFDLSGDFGGNFSPKVVQLFKPRPPGPVDQLRIFCQQGEDLTGIGIDGEGGFDVFINFGRVDFNMDNLRTDGESRQIARHPVIEAHPEGDDQIGIQQRSIGFHSPVHPHQTETQWMVDRQGRQTMQRESYGYMRLFSELRQIPAGIAVDDPVPAKDDRLFAAVDQAHRLFDKFAVRHR